MVAGRAVVAAFKQGIGETVVWLSNAVLSRFPISSGFCDVPA